MERDSFIFYRSFFEAIRVLKDADRLKVYDAIVEKALNDKEIELTGLSNSMFILIKPQLEANNRKYVNGKKGGRPKNKKQDESETKAKQNQNETLGFEKEQENKNLNKTLGFKKDIKNKNQNESKTKANVNDNENVNVNENDNDNAECIMQCYEQNIGIFNPASAELILSYLNDLPRDLIIEAIKIASQRNKKSSKYIAGILNSWINKGYKTLSDVKNEQLEQSEQFKKESIEEVWEDE